MLAHLENLAASALALDEDTLARHFRERARSFERRVLQRGDGRAARGA